MLNDNTYRCPVCGEAMTRELLLFLAHSKEHIYEVLKKEHPEWMSPDGSWDKYGRYLQEQLASGC